MFVISTKPYIPNTALDAVAVSGELLYLINDSWQRVYLSNMVRLDDKQKHEAFAPLIFELPTEQDWFTQYKA